MTRDFSERMSHRAQEIQSSGIRKFFDLLGEMKDVVSLTVGQPDFVTPWHIRAAAIARKIYLRPAGIGALRRVFGCKKDGNSRPGKASLASGAILRSCVQQLEAMKIVEKDKNG